MANTKYKLVLKPDENVPNTGLRTLNGIPEQPFIDQSGNIDMCGNYLLVKNIEAGTKAFTTNGEKGIINVFSDSTNTNTSCINFNHDRNNMGGNNRRYCSFQPINTNFIAGSITGNSATVSYNTTSDERAKNLVIDNKIVDNISRFHKPYSGAYNSYIVSSEANPSIGDITFTSWLDSVNALHPLIYQFKSDVVVDTSFNFDISLNDTIERRSVNYQGFFAHDVQAIYPPAVTGMRNQTDSNGDPVYQQLDMTKLIPMMVGAIQELSEKVNTMESFLLTKFIYSDGSTSTSNDTIITNHSYIIPSGESLTTVSFPTLSVISIGQFSLVSTMMPSITIPANITNIGFQAFQNETKMTDINVSANNAYYTDISGVLLNKDKTTLICYPIGKVLTTYEIPSTVITIGQLAFIGSTYLNTITITENVTIIESQAFQSVTNLTSVIFDEDSKLSTIGSYAFAGASSLASITIPKSVTSIGGDVFKLTNLSRVNIKSSTITTLNKTVPSPNIPMSGGIMTSFYGSGEVTVNVIVDSGLFTTFTYYNNTNGGSTTTSTSDDLVITAESYDIPDPQFVLTKVNIGSNVTSISGETFYGQQSLSSVTFSEGSKIASIGEKAFMNTGIESITIPASVESIGDYALMAITSLDTVYFEDESKLDTIGKYAFAYLGIESITIPSSVESIGALAFMQTTNLKSVIFEENSQLIKIENGAFLYSGLTSVTLYPNTITKLNDAGADPKIPTQSESLSSFYSSGEVSITVMQ